MERRNARPSPLSRKSPVFSCDGFCGTKPDPRKYTPSHDAYIQVKAGMGLRTGYDRLDERVPARSLRAAGG